VSFAGHLRGGGPREGQEGEARGRAVTEAEWLACTDPQKMLAFLREGDRAGDRKLRLFACACLRRTWHLLADECSRRAVEVAERYAAGEATRGDSPSPGPPGPPRTTPGLPRTPPG
jgi:hypothetical protein